jgi:hypothetical protein
MAHVLASNTTSNFNLLRGKRLASRSSQPEIYHLSFVRLSVEADCLPVDWNGLWPISAGHWPILGSLAPFLPLTRTFQALGGDGLMSGDNRPPTSRKQ